MRTRDFAWALCLVCFACDKSPPAAAGPAPSAAPVASAAPVDTPQGCQATGTDPVELGTVLGDVFGFGQDKTTLYYTSWQVYGGRGDLGTIRKDGKRGRALASLDLEPQSLALDGDTIYYTSGIQLMSEPVAGGSPRTLFDQFQSRAIAVGSDVIYGVPGDYGPYDRLVKGKKTGQGDLDEIAKGDRPEKSDTPNGYSRVLADSAAVYVTDSGNNRVLAFPLPKGTHKVVASNVKRPFDLAMDADTLYFDLASDGALMSVPKSGGKPKKLATGLVKNARIAADARAVYAPFAGPKDDDPQKLSEVTPDGSVKPIATVPGLQSVAAIALDDACVYWAVTVDATKSIVYARKR